jgi:DNA helicase-2/ATP-dependent DNA helicase PcrA
VRERIFADLNPEQRRAVEAVRGPVCILAGAGSGKTTTITRRIANQVASGAFPSSAILAVTFTDKAATEMRRRLEGLGVRGVRTSTFHAAALSQLRYFRGLGIARDAELQEGRARPVPPSELTGRRVPESGRRPDAVGRILAAKALMLRHIGNTLPRPYRYRPAGDLATEIEWAKNRRLTPADYQALRNREPPIPHDLMSRVFREYERRKADGGWVDFEDLLELAIRLFDDDPNALAEVRDRYRSFTVDEYQDVNLLQQTLLECWLGDGNEICAVGDDYQAIYAFTGATPEYLLSMPQRFPGATVVRLESNYRSSPEVLGLANRLVPRLGGAEKVLRAACPGGPEPVTRGFRAAADEGEFMVERIRSLHAEGIAYEEMAVLVRTNARTADFEEVLADAELPFQGSALLARDGARQLLKVLARLGHAPAAVEVRRVAREQGWQERPPDRLGEREMTRQNDLARLVRLAEEFDGSVAEFIAFVQERFGAGGENRGVHLLTLHRAKGLEFDAVFLPRLEERELPWRLAKGRAQIDEERRLFYVGMTRAKRHLIIAWAGKPSRFLDELGVQTRPQESSKQDLGDLPPAFGLLRRWRLERAKADGIPAFVVFHDSTLAEIARKAPRSMTELANIPGVGPTKLERYGAEVLSELAAG